MSDPKKDLEIFADELARKAEEEVREFIAEYCEIKIAEELQGFQLHIESIYKALTEISEAVNTVTEILNIHIEQGATHGPTHSHTVPPDGPGYQPSRG